MHARCARPVAAQVARKHHTMQRRRYRDRAAQGSRRRAVAFPARAPQQARAHANEDLRSRVTYSVLLPKLAPDDVAAFIRAKVHRAGLPHAVSTADALALVVRGSDGVPRRVRNLCFGALIEI